ncbi:toxin-antitoxin system YwqK family antitoxin [Membranihabitans marinus]|uniref:toxin-antitoxin system YwqK family antitoxin n=1 Tax=Membranihabitans marinus TaxID=1227546 RepID=UPI001F32E049|nr:hypothetical protein [Membranihabitans marinus]
MSFLKTVFVFLGFTASIVSCKTDQSSMTHHDVEYDYSIDTTMIPADTIVMTDVDVELVNGKYYYKEKLFSGILYKEMSRDGVRSYSSVYHGMLHGTYRSYYPSGRRYEVRQYKDNLATGKHRAYWEETGELKFEYQYYEEKREGMQRKWHPSGRPFIFSNYVNDKEQGLQQAWRENGKLYSNYEVVDGQRYGLQKTVMCYELINEEVQQSNGSSSNGLLN